MIILSDRFDNVTVNVILRKGGGGYPIFVIRPLYTTYSSQERRTFGPYRAILGYVLDHAKLRQINNLDVLDFDIHKFALWRIYQNPRSRKF
jgi:hypothetical protein